MLRRASIVPPLYQPLPQEQLPRLEATRLPCGPQERTSLVGFGEVGCLCWEKTPGLGPELGIQELSPGGSVPPCGKLVSVNKLHELAGDPEPQQELHPSQN